MIKLHPKIKEVFDKEIKYWSKVKNLSSRKKIQKEGFLRADEISEAISDIEWKLHSLAMAEGIYISTDSNCLRGAVTVWHEDGSQFYFNNAFYIDFYGWIIVFSEHNGTQSFAKDDLDFYTNLEIKDGD